MAAMLSNILGFIWSEKSYYMSAKNAENFRAELHSLFDTRSFDVNLSGKFKAGIDTTFVVTPRWSFIHFRDGESDEAYVKGTFQSTIDKKTIIELRTRPNSIFPIMALLFFACRFSAKIEQSPDIIAKNIFTILIPLLLLMLAYFLKIRLKNRFVNTLKLTPTEEIFTTDTRR